MADHERIGYGIAIAGGIGPGLLLGSEFSGPYATFSGAALTIVAILGIIILSLRRSP